MNEHREDEESYECFIFCQKHLEIGKRDLKIGGKERIKATPVSALINEKLKKMTGGAFTKRGMKKSARGRFVNDTNYDIQDEEMDEEEAGVEEDEDDVDIGDSDGEG